MTDMGKDIWTVQQADAAARALGYPELVVARRASVADRFRMIALINRLSRTGGASAWTRLRVLAFSVRTYIRPTAQVCYPLTAPLSPTEDADRT